MRQSTARMRKERWDVNIVFCVLLVFYALQGSARVDLPHHSAVLNTNWDASILQT